MPWNQGHNLKYILPFGLATHDQLVEYVSSPLQICDQEPKDFKVSSFNSVPAKHTNLLTISG